MKRIFVGLITLGLAIGLMLGCQLQEPEAGIDQTQVSSVALTLTDGAFGQDMTRTVESGYVIDGWEYKHDDTLGDATKTTITFFADGAWEYKVESYEKSDKEEGNTTQTADNHNGNSTDGEGWVQSAGYKGTYSYDAETMVMTLNYNGIVWENGTSPAYDTAWDDSDNEPVVGNHVEVTFPFIFADLGVDDDGYANFIGETEVEALSTHVTNESDILWNEAGGPESLSSVFDADDGTEGYRYISGGSYVQTYKVWENTDTTAPEYTTYASTENFAISDTEITYYLDGYRKTHSGTYFDNGSSDKVVYSLDLAAGDSLNDSDGVEFAGAAENCYLVETYAYDTINSSTGAVTRETDVTISNTPEKPGASAGGSAYTYDWMKAYGEDAYIAY